MTITNPDVLVALRSAGWEPGREVNGPDWSSWFEEEGYSSQDEAVAILAEFGGLAIDPSASEESAFAPARLVFNPMLASTGESPRITLREAQMGVTLTPLGEWASEYIVLYGGDGAIYVESTFGVKMVGQGLEQALETMLLGNRTPTKVLDG